MTPKAKAQFQCFIDFWGEGDIDRDAVKDVYEFLQREGSSDP